MLTIYYTEISVCIRLYNGGVCQLESNTPSSYREVSNTLNNI